MTCLNFLPVEGFAQRVFRPQEERGQVLPPNLELIRVEVVIAAEWLSTLTRLRKFQSLEVGKVGLALQRG
jgi:hypothetical protein